MRFDPKTISRGALVVFTFVSTIFFPWLFTAILAIVVSFTEPLVPLAVGIFVDVLYFSPQTSVWPVFTIGGALCTVVMLFVRSRLRTSIIG